MSRPKTIADQDVRTDKMVAVLALCTAAAGAMAEVWPVVAVLLVLAILLGLVIVLRRADAAQNARLDAGDTVCTADDVRLADVARQDGEA